MSLQSVDDYESSEAGRRLSAASVPATTASSRSIGTAERHFYLGAARGAADASSLSSSVGGGTGSSRALSLRASPFRQSPSPLIVRKLKSAAELMRESNELQQQQRRRRARHHHGGGGSGATSSADRSRPHTSYIPSLSSLKCESDHPPGDSTDKTTWQGEEESKVAAGYGISRSQSVKNSKQAGSDRDGCTANQSALDDNQTSRSNSETLLHTVSPINSRNSRGTGISATERVHIVCITATPTNLQTDLTTSTTTTTVSAGGGGGSGGDVGLQSVKQLSSELTSLPRGPPVASGSSSKPSRSKFLDSNWFQKPKKFFKTSK